MATNYQKKLNKTEKKLANFGNFNYQNQGLIDDTLKQIANRKAFSYDANSDALYDNYVQQYKALGKTAMQDTVAQGAALTGGYDNSYAQSAGQQAYNDYVSKAGEMIPTLYNLALQKYQTDSDTLNNKYSVLANDKSQALSEYQDKYSRLSALADYYANQNQNSISNKLNAQQLAEQIRSNKAGESLNAKQLAEQIRSNKVSESLNKKQLDETIRSNEASAYSNALEQKQKASDARIKRLSNGITKKFSRNKHWDIADRGAYIAEFIHQNSGEYTKEEVKAAMTDAGWNYEDLAGYINSKYYKNNK